MVSAKAVKIGLVLLGVKATVGIGAMWWLARKRAGGRFQSAPARARTRNT